MQPHQQYVNSNGGPYNAFGNAESQPMEFFHELDSKFKAQIQSLIPSHEQIFYSGTIEKINKRLVFQKRILVITNKYLYNIRPEGEGFFASILPPLGSASIQRKVDISNIFAVSLSVRSQGNKNQFVLHVAGEYDYRYNGGANTEKIIKTIANIYNKAHNAPFIMHFIEETDLARFHTTDDDISNGVNRRPRDGKVLVTSEVMQKGLSWIIANRFAILQAQEAQKPKLKQADTLVKVKQQLYTSAPLIGGLVQVQPAITVVQRPVTTVVYNPPVNVVTVGRTNIVTTTTTTMPIQQVVQTTTYQQQQQVVQPTYTHSQPTQNLYNNQPQYGSAPMMNQPNYNNQYVGGNNQYGGGNNFNTTGSNNAQNNLSDLVGVSQTNVTINSNFENKK